MAPPKKLSMNPNMRVSVAQKAAAVNASRPEVTKPRNPHGHQFIFLSSTLNTTAASGS